MALLIDRGFVRLPSGLVHYRSAGNGDGLPLLMAHAGPGSSLGLVPMFEALADGRRLIAPDMLGNGDSEAHALAAPQIEHYADDVASLLDALAIERVDFYGQHTGAHIGCEFALRHPGRVRRLVLDGVGLFPAALRAALQAHYAPPMAPDDHGGHLLWAWTFVRDLSLHFPYFQRDPAHRLHDSAVPPPAALHSLTVELLKALPSYHLAYAAAFAHPIAARLPLLTVPTLLMTVQGDPLGQWLDAAAALLPTAQLLRTARAGRGLTVRDFIDG